MELIKSLEESFQLPGEKTTEVPTLSQSPTSTTTRTEAQLVQELQDTVSIYIIYAYINDE